MRHRTVRGPGSLAGLVGAAAIAVLLSACGGSNAAKQPAQHMLRVGLMHVGLDHLPPSLKPLEARLRELGWVQGRNIDLIWRNLPNEDAAGAQAEAFVKDDVDLIVAFEDQSVRQAKAATSVSHTPVVFLHPVDPVQAGYVRSLGHPGGNLTGVFGLRDLVAKQLELYKAVVPGLHRVLALVDPLDPSTAALWKQSRAAATRLNLQLVVRKAATPEELMQVFGSVRRADHLQAVFVVSPKLLFNYSQLLIGLAEGEAHLPLELNRKEWVQKGALFSYGPDFELIGREGARYVDSILRGAKPSDLPVEEEPRVQFTLNLTTARKFAIHVPESTTILADRVYR
jgi:putative tryptophan/tyrosine transport system substrate-binding protein